MREKIPYGYKCFTGIVLTNGEVDEYNAIQETINSFEKANLPVPEYLLNGSFNLFVAISRAY
jgi:hypothetical protein